MDTDDIELPYPDPDPDIVEESTVKSLIAECKSKNLKFAGMYSPQALYNERMGVGKQDMILDESQSLTKDPSWGNSQFTSRNLLRNLRLTWSSRILEDRPSTRSYPVHPGADLKNAENSDKILEYKKQNDDWDNLWFKCANIVQDHSVVGIKVVWDPLYGPISKGYPSFDEQGNPVLDEQGMPVLEGVGEPLGEVRWQIVTLFDYGTDGSEEIEDSKYVYFETYIDKIDAAGIYETVGIKESPVESEYEDQWGIKRKGVLVTELWYKPDYRFPDGLFAVVIGDKSIQAIKYPYDHYELPLAVWKCGPRRNSPYGSTHMDDAVYIQRSINEIVAAMAKQAREIRDVKLLGPSAMINAIKAGNQMIPLDDVQLIQASRYLEPPGTAKILIEQLEDQTKALYNIFGLNEMLTGAENIKSGTAAKSIAYLNKLDSMKLAGAARSLNVATLRVIRQTLKLYQQNAIAPRIAHILGDNNLLSAMEWKNSDIAGTDVRLEPISGFANMRATIVQEGKEQMQVTGPTPELQSQVRTGLQQTAFDKAQREVIQGQIKLILQGQPIQPDLSVDSNIATDEILVALSSYRGTAFEPILKDLYMKYMQRGTQQQMEDAELAQIEGKPLNGQI